MKILEKFGENRLKFVEKLKIVNIWRMISIGQVKCRNLPAKFWAFGPNMKKILQLFKKILRFFDQNYYGKLTFFHKFLLNISWSSAFSPKVYTRLEDNTNFLQQFFPISLLVNPRIELPPTAVWYSCIDYN